MQFKRLHPDFVLPTKGSEAAGGWDLTMPTAGRIHRSEQGRTHSVVQLGFAAKVPDGHVALILPRSGAGAKFGIELRNTVGVIDADYTGEWMVAAKQKEGQELDWAAGDRLFQFIVVPVATIAPELVEDLPVTARGAGGFGSTGVGTVSVDGAVQEPTARVPAAGQTSKQVEQVGGGVPAKVDVVLTDSNGTKRAEAKGISADQVKVTPTGEAKAATAPAPKVDGEAKAATTETTQVDGAAQAE